MRTYLKELEHRKFTPQKQPAFIHQTQDYRNQSPHSSFKKKSIKDESSELSPLRSNSNRLSSSKIYLEMEA
jgi:hypothetical protein